MRAAVPLMLTLLGGAAAKAIERRDPPAEDYGDDDKDDKKEVKPWKPKTQSPHFFNLKVDDRCETNSQYGVEEPPYGCPFEGYALRLENKIVIATPYNKWWDPKLPTFFVDDDTQLYTVSKDPLQLYIDAVTGALKYTKVGWLPPNSISTSFYHTGNNPLGLVDPSPSYLTWPSTYGYASYGNWLLCPLGETGQFQVFVNDNNFYAQGVGKDLDECKRYGLAAVNSNPWKKSKPSWGKEKDDDKKYDDKKEDDKKDYDY